jgi:hypothetical protein
VDRGLSRIQWGLDNRVSREVAQCDAGMAAHSGAHTRQNTTPSVAKVRHDVASFDSRAIADSLSVHPAVDSDFTTPHFNK